VIGKTVTRKNLVTALSIIYIINGVWDIGIFLSPLASLPKSIALDLAPLIGSALALYVGFYLFRFHEFGRKLAIFLLFVRMAVNSAFMVWAFAHQKEFVGSGLYFLEEQIYHLDNRYAFQIFLFAWIIIALLVIVFLSHKETKEIFLPEQSNDSNKIIESA